MGFPDLGKSSHLQRRWRRVFKKMCHQPSQNKNGRAINGGVEAWASQPPDALRTQQRRRSIIRERAFCFLYAFL
jgi:hypothetical protein